MFTLNSILDTSFLFLNISFSVLGRYLIPTAAREMKFSTLASESNSYIFHFKMCIYILSLSKYCNEK